MKMMPVIKYGMKICGFVHPLEIFGPIAFTSSNTKRIYAEFEITRYWDDDTDPMSYKIILMPTSKYYRCVAKERMYSSDFASMLWEQGSSFIRAKDVFNSFIDYIKLNGIVKNGYYILSMKDKNLGYNGYKLYSIKVPISKNYNDIKLYLRKGLFRKMVLLKNINNSTEFMCRTFMKINN